MFEAIVITLREGVEAALVIAIALAFLRRRGLDRLMPALFAGTAAALGVSVFVAWLATRTTWNEELAEGIAMLVGAALVITLVAWMWRAAPRMREQIESGLGRAAAPAGDAPSVAGGTLGVFLFAFAMVFREGVETAIFLSAARFNSEGLSLWLGAAIGLGLAIAFGILFVRGTLRVPLKPFFTITTAVLALFALQLVVGGLHELSEAGVLPASRAEMAIVGPIVKSDLLLMTLTIAMVGGWLVLGAGRPAAVAAPAPGPEARLALATARRDATRRRWTGMTGLLVAGVLLTAFVQGSRQPERVPGTPLPPSGGEVRFATAALADGRMRFYESPVTGGTVRFFAVQVGEDLHVCLDACEICGDMGYYEQGMSVVCRNCEAPIVRTSLGRSGGCNPIPLAHRVEPGGTIAVAEKDLVEALPKLKGR